MALTAPSNCLRCGGPLGPEAAGGVCSSCEFAAAMRPPPADAVVAAAEDLSDAKRFGDYELLEEIAHGGMGVVYRARHLKLNRIVALKMLLLGQFASDQAIQRFQREAQAAAALRHPGIVDVYEVGEFEGQHFFTMEFVEGRTLASLLRAGPLPARGAATYLQAIAEATAHAHSAGIVHRDLKPSNILIDLFDAPRITDFGLARRLDGTGDITLSGHIVGSPNYLAPELLDRRPFSKPLLKSGTQPDELAPETTREDRSAPATSEAATKLGQALHSPLADIFSLGAVLYECLTGRAPFLGATLEETLLRVRDADPVAPRILNSQIPRDLETICLKCLEKDPSRRYTGAQELADELGRFLEGLAIQARPITRLGRTWRWARRKPALAALSAALITVAGLGLSGILWQWGRANSAAKQARQLASQARENFVHQLVAKGNDLAAHDQVLEALPWFLAAWENEPDPQPHRIEAHQIRMSTALRLAPRPEQIWKHSNTVNSVAFNPNEQWVASASEDRTARVWSLESGKPVTPPLVHSEVVRGLSFHPNGRLLLTFSSQREILPQLHFIAERGQGSVHLWSLPEGRELWSSRFTNIVPHAAFSPAGDRIVAVCADGYARVWRVRFDADRPEVVLDFNLHHPAEVRSFAFHPTSDQIATGARDNGYRVWDLTTGRLIHTFDNGRSESDYSAYSRKWEVSFSPDGRQLLSGQDRHVRVWDLTSGTNRAEIGVCWMVNTLRYSPEGRTFVSADVCGNVQTWLADSGRKVSEVHTRDYSATTETELAANFSADGTLIYFWNRDGLQFLTTAGSLPSPPPHSDAERDSRPVEPRRTATRAWDP